MSAPYRRTRGDLIATAVIAVVSLVLVAAAFLTAPIRASQLSPAEKQYESAARLSTPPTTLQESFRLPDTSPGVSPVIAEGMIISYADGTLRATTPQGETAWTYQRDLELCTLDQAWGKVEVGAAVEVGGVDDLARRLMGGAHPRASGHRVGPFRIRSSTASAASMRAVCLVPSPPVMPWTMTSLSLVRKIAIFLLSPLLVRQLGGLVGAFVHGVGERDQRVVRVAQDRAGEADGVDLEVRFGALGLRQRRQRARRP